MKSSNSIEHKPPVVSVIIPARNEFPQIAFTVQSIINDLETFLKPGEFEIIICNNCSSDEIYPKRGTGGTVDYLMPRGMYWNRTLRVLYDPIAGNHSTRNHGAMLARGKYIFFSDAHMSYKRGFFQRMIRVIDKTGGLVHGTIGWLGAYPIGSSMGYQYTMKLGEEIKGTWNNYKLADDYFHIPLQGHCCLGMLRKQFIEFDGYPKYHRCYGGGEFYLDIKWWLFGSNVSVDPQAIGYHLSAPRGYSYNHDDYKHNVLAIGLAIGADEWAERAYINWCRRGRPEVMARIWKEAQEETKEDKAWIAKKRVKTFNQLLVERPWDKMNDKLHGKHNSSMLIFHDTWLPLIKGTPAEELYNKSELQKKLAKFIDENLSDKVYKRGYKPPQIEIKLNKKQLQYLERNKVRYDAMRTYIQEYPRILDFGIGQGGYYYGTREPKVLGIDNDKVLLNRAKEYNPNLEIVHGDVLTAEIKERDFPLIILSEILEHLEDYQPLIDRAKEFSKENGRFLITVPINSPKHKHFHPIWSKEDARKLAYKFGILEEIKKVDKSWLLYVRKT